MLPSRICIRLAVPSYLVLCKFEIESKEICRARLLPSKMSNRKKRLRNDIETGVYKSTRYKRWQTAGRDVYSLKVTWRKLGSKFCGKVFVLGKSNCRFSEKWNLGCYSDADFVCVDFGNRNLEGRVFELPALFLLANEIHVQLDGGTQRKICLLTGCIIKVMWYACTTGNPSSFMKVVQTLSRKN